MFGNNRRLYMLNESLLDDVEIDEVSDEGQETNVYDYKYKIIFGFGNAGKVYNDKIKHMLTTNFDIFVNAGKIESYTYNESDWTGYPTIIQGDLIGIKSDIDVYSDILVRTAAVARSFMILRNSTNYFTVSFSNSSDSDSEIEISVKSTCNFELFIYDCLYDNGFGFSDDKNVIKSIFQYARKYNMVHYADEEKTMCAILLNRRMCMVDRDGNILYSYDMTGPVFHDNEFQYDKNGLMHIKFSRDKENFLDKKGQKLLKVNYYSCGLFNDGRAVVYNYSGEYNFIDLTGELKSTEMYTSIEDFKNGIAKVKRYEDNIYRFRYVDIDNNDICGKYNINENGNGLTYDRKYIEVYNGSNEWNFIVVSGKYNSKDGHNPLVWNGKWFCGFKDYNDDYMSVRMENGAWSVLSMKDGKLLLDNGYDDVCYLPGCDMCAVKKSEDEKWHIVDIQTEEDIFEECFDSCSIEYENVYLVSKNVLNEDKKVVKYLNIINKDGDIVFDKWYRGISYIQEGFYSVWDDTNGTVITHIVSTSGKEILKHSYGLSIDDFYEGYSVVTRNDSSYKNREYNVIDTNGNYVSKDIWFEKITDYRQGFWLVYFNKKWNVLSAKTGKLLIPNTVKIEQYVKVVEDNECVIVRDFDKKYNAYDNNGNPLLEEYTDDVIYVYDTGILQIGLNILVNSKGNVVSLI